MNHYRFESEWIVQAPVEDVFDAMADLASYPVWWRAIRGVQVVEQGDSGGTGSRSTYEMRSLGRGLRFDFKIIEIDRPRRIRGLVRGDLIGTGAYSFEDLGSTTEIRHVWSLSPAERWMSAPLFRPLLAWAHRRVMERGCAGLASRLGCLAISTRSRLVSDRREGFSGVDLATAPGRSTSEER